MFACAAAYAAQNRELNLTIADLDAPGFSARSIRAVFSGPDLRSLRLTVGRLTIAERTFNKATLTCDQAELTAARIACPAGVLDLGDKIPLSFAYSTKTRELTVQSQSTSDETWRFTGRFGSKPSALELEMKNARIDRIAPWLPRAFPKVSAGRASGQFSKRGDAITARVELDGLAFADASGLHAGEKIGATLEASARAQGEAWHWNASVLWRSGEVFWQPVFIAAKRQRLALAGTTARGITHVSDGRLELPGIGAVAMSGAWHHAQGELGAFRASAARLRVATLYQDLLKPLVQGTAVDDLRAEGELSVSVAGAGRALTAAELTLHDVSFEDRARRFAVFGVIGRLPWRSEVESKGEIELKGAELLKVPVGAMRIPIRLRRTRVDIDSVRIPIFDGAVHLRDFALGLAKDQQWRWRFSGELTPLSMEQITAAFGAPIMHGTLSGKLPELRYRRGVLEMDGALDIRVFDGIVTASRLRLIEPFGRAPRLHADVEMKNIDLDLLTRTVDFGTITGRIDARIGGLELVNWQPVRFDAHIASSPGSYPRKISQRAVQNISALGGAGAAAAIQRSLLRFFDQFGYEKLGLSCKLENGICMMDGIERAPQGYVIVKGGGIPAISVIGYNRAVDWHELVERLKRITQDNVKPIVE